MEPVDPYEEVARRHQDGLVEVLRQRGVADPAVLRAFAAVPRHRFVDRFRIIPPAGGTVTGDAARWVVVGEDTDALDLVYDPDRALVTAGSVEEGVATSSVSAPGLVAEMLVELDLAPGRRVLEIGAGSGYHAALMAVLVGDPAAVTTVEIDAALAEDARRRLAALGLGAIGVVTGDGSAGFASGAPYDRVVATVGCADVAPAWIDQLSPAGRVLVPLVHGAWHPRVLLSPSPATGPGGVAGRFVAHSGFVTMQGDQAGGSPWPRLPLPAAAGAPPPAVRHQALPPDVAERLHGLDGAVERSGSFALYLSLRDGRAGPGCLCDRPATDDGPVGPGGAYLRGDRLVITGAGDGDALAARLVELTRDWLDLGAPRLDRFRTAFTRRPMTAPRLVEPTTAAGPWVVERLHHRQVVTLADPG
jgi:protein-L-isoaspartate O-methyltransferase